ncbi:copper resistance CopC family protein [Pseudarthrobacter sp. NIBRBAC000502770]|uniref:copper resistance CopC family protein n=1 Tax=Pseudarthrobacter sp. NIBRBAC000502770 TaxID=2590785 RepID=UPI0011406F2D|nr:copper resistance CopC family protein [Pseudarthrobacter sp. NIBRBAC000502770]QDG88125.1 copper resistance protein CopC [Pseudarthrobacter sp. NIBRBAC000502770]
MKTQRHGPTGRLSRTLLPLVTPALLMAPTAAAQAHDALESSDPANGSTVSTVPAKVGLTFDHTPIAINSIVRVQDATGTDQADRPVTIIDNHVTQAIKPDAPNGKYTVVWRVVSSDGHPIEGTFTFTAGTTNTNAPTQAPSAAATEGPSFQTRLITAVATAIVLLIAFGVLALFVRRRLRSPETEN